MVKSQELNSVILWFRNSLAAEVDTMYVDEVVLAGVAAVGLCIAFFVGLVIFIANDAKNKKPKQKSVKNSHRTDP